MTNHEHADDIIEDPEAAMAFLGLEDSSVENADSEDTVDSLEPASDSKTSISMEDLFDVARELGIILFPSPLPEHFSPRLPYNMTVLSSQPHEIKAEIFGWVVGVDHRIDLTVAHAKNGQPRLWFSSFFSDMREPFSTYLRACSGLRKDGTAHLISTTVFFNRFSDSAKHFPKLYGSLATGMIQHFELHAQFTNKTSHEKTWPALLNTFVENMPNLKRFTRLTNYLTFGQVFSHNESGDPTGSVSRHDQKRRSLLRFGTCCTLRHPTLKVMVVPATSGSWYLNEYNEHRTVIRIEIYQSEVTRPIQRVLRRTLPTIEEAIEHAVSTSQPIDQPGY